MALCYTMIIFHLKEGNTMATKKAKPSIKKTTVTKPKSISNVTTIAKVKQFILCRCKTTDGKPIIGALVAEFIGTFLIVASILTVQGQPLFVAFALIGVVLVIGGISGAHINPAMTISAWVTRKMCSVCAIGYIIAQVLGATAAWLTLNAFLSGSATSGGVAPSLFHAATLTVGKEWYIFFAELLGAAILAFGFATALRAMKKDKTVAAFTYGLAILVALLIAGSATAIFLTESNTGLTFLNPAIALVASGLSWNVWPIAIYVFAPIIGGIVGFVIQDFLQAQSTDK